MYIGIHNHTDYSNFRLRDSINRVPDLIEYTHSLGHKGICFTDHETISNALAVENYFNKVKSLPEWEGFKVGLGNEIYLCSDETSAENKDNTDVMTFPHFVLLALNAEGHKQIRKISTRAWNRAFMYKGIMRVPTYISDLEDIIGESPGNVIGSSACLGGSIPRLILSHNEDGARAWINALTEIFGKGNFFLEMQPSYNEDQRYVNQKILALAYETDTPYIISTDAHYLKKDDADIHKIYLNSQDGDREVEEFYASTYVMSEEEIHEYLDDNIGISNVQRGIDNTMLIYDRLTSYSLKRPLHIPYMPLDNSEPDVTLYNKYVELIPLLKEFYESSESCDRHLVREIVNAFEHDESFREHKMYEHIGTCLDTILKSSEKMNVRWSAYLLQIANYVKVAWAKGDSLVGIARGSGCGFGLLNVLGITQVNPLKENTKTYYWRFLNPERASVLD